MAVRYHHLLGKVHTYRAKLYRSLHIRYSTYALIGAVIIVAGVIAFSASSNDGLPAATKSPQAHAQELRSQVDTTDGAPRPGRDPANQPQGSLASAASQPTGTGRYVNKPAANVQGTTGNDTSASHHSHNAGGNGIGSNGCYIDYGKPGEQCVPVHAAQNGTLTCEGVRKHFPSGVIVSGTDRFHLDTNHDGTACGIND